MSALSGAVETAPVSDLHALGSTDPADFPVPGGREEEWRFTPLRRLRGLHSDAAPDRRVRPPVGSHGRGRGGAGAARCRRSRTAVSTVPAESDRRVPADRPGERPGVRRRAPRRTVITVPKDTTASQPTFVRVTGTDASVATAGHLVIDVQPYGRATVVIDQRGSATYADNVEIHVGDGGDLVVVALADWAGDTVQVAHHQATLGRDAHLTHFAVTLGGGLVRLSPSVRYAGPGGDAELYGICFADAGQHLEHRLFVDHDTPNCRSRVGYKGALRGEGAHTVWIGDVLIRPEAVGTDTYEYNRNLVLTDGAHADSVPNLEILTGEMIGAGHASASGRPRRRAHVLPDVPRHPPRGSATTGHPGLLRRAGLENRDQRPTGPHHVRDRSGAVDHGGTVMSGSESPAFVKACALSDIPEQRHPVGRAQPRRDRDRPHRGRGLRDPRLVLARRRPALGGRGRRLHDRVLAAQLALRPAHRQADRDARDAAGARLPSEDRGRRRPRRYRGVVKQCPPLRSATCTLT